MVQGAKLEDSLAQRPGGTPGSTRAPHDHGLQAALSHGPLRPEILKTWGSAQW